MAQGSIATIDVRRLLAVFRRRLRLFGGIALGVMALTVAGTLLATPKYTATAQVMLDPRNQNVTETQDVLAPLPADSAAVDTEVDVLRSRQLAARVTQSLGLERDPEFNTRLRPDTRAQALLRRIGLAPTKSASLLSPRSRERVVDAVIRAASINRSGLTNIIDVGFRSTDPAKAVRVADAFAQLYIVQQVEAKHQATHQASTWLNSRLGELRGQVLADDAALQQYKIDHNLLSASGATLTEQEISNYNQTLAQATTQLAEDRARLDTARRQLARGSTGDDVGETLNSPAIQKLKEQRAEASRRVASLETQFKDAYPGLKTARSELADVDAQIAAETRRIISNLAAKTQVSRQRVNSIQATLGGAKGQLAANNRAAVRLNELERNADASRTLYETYLARYKETSTQEGLQKPDARLISTAGYPTTPSSPNVTLNLLLGAFLAVGAGLAGVVLAEGLQNGLAGSADVERRFSMRYLGALPSLGSVAGRTRIPPVDYVVAKPFSGFSEAFRSLRASILYGAAERSVKVVSVTSALPGEGKTTAAICLGRAAALLGSKVIVVDCDLRKRGVQAMIGAEARHGLLDVLAGEVGLAEAVVKDPRTNADFLFMTEEPAAPGDAFGSRSIDRLLNQLKDNYDLVILDTAPVLPVADTRVLARKSDFVLFVAKWRVTPYLAVQGALKLLADTQAAADGIVLNQVDMGQQARYGYGEVDHYFPQYQSYYLEAPRRGAAG